MTHPQAELAREALVERHDLELKVKLAAPTMTNGSFPCLHSFANLRGVSRAHRGFSSRLPAESTIETGAREWGQGNGRKT